MTNSTIQEFKNLLFQKASQYGFSDCEIYYSTDKELQISIFKADLEQFENSTSGGVSFRGLFNDKMGYAYSEKIDVSIIDTLLENAKQNAKIISDDEKEEIFGGSESYSKPKTFFDEIDKIEVDTMIAKGLEIEKYILEYDPKIIACNDCALIKSSSQMFLSNSKGLDLSTQKNYFIVYASCLAKKDPNNQEDQNIKNDHEIKIFFDVNDLNTKEFAETVATKTLSYLDASSIKSQDYNIVFSGDAFSSLLSCFVSNFFAENVQKGFSLLKGKLNTQIASDKITILDEPLLEKTVRCTGFDSEGVACFNKEVVRNGELKTYLYNLKSAKKDGVSSTGNGFKAGYKGKVSTASANFYIKNGEISLDDLFKQVGDGVFLTELSGLHSGVNHISGDFSLLTKGFVIKDGKKGAPVEQITISGNFFDVFKNIQEVSSDLKFKMSGVSSPSVFAGKLTVSGE
ncbi:MAG: TldD/PmbA family protein [bacterium]